jgi:arabinose-5-phosphate isomerase
MNNLPGSEILATARDTLHMESEALLSMEKLLTEDFEKVVRLVAASDGRAVVTGIGKSAIIAQKIVATLNSTGTAAMFMHAGDAIHGDLGMIQQNDIVLCLSKSGESPEIKMLVPLLRNFHNPLVAIVGNINSYLAREATYVLDTTVNQEACPNNLAPTASTTAQLAMGDALAVCLMKIKGFSQEDFAKFHPGGTLGKKLYLRVADLSGQNEKPSVSKAAPMMEVIMEITEKRLGMTAVTKEGGQIAGIITDGDLRRMLKEKPTWESLTAGDVMNPSPRTISGGELAVNALELMRRHNITQLIVLEKGMYTGVIHLHDLIREGFF